MAVPSSGELKLWDTLWNQELLGSQGENSLHSASIYAGFSTPDALSDFYGWSDVEVPGVTTGNASSVTANSMVLNGTITDTGNQAVSRGFYHGTNANAYSNNPKYTVSGTQESTGGFSFTRSSLSYNTLYYFWAWASNDAGEAQGARNQSTTNVPAFSPSTAVFAYRTVFTACPFSFGSASLTMQYLNPYTSTYAAQFNQYSGNATVGVNQGSSSPININSRLVQYRNQYSACTTTYCDNLGGWMRVDTAPFNGGASWSGGTNQSNVTYNGSTCFRGNAAGPNRSGGGHTLYLNFRRNSDIRLKTNITYL